MISDKLKIKKWQVENTIKLLEEGSTIPFISRYRKEQTGELDEVIIGKIRDDLAKLAELDARRTYILAEIEKQGKLTGELKRQITDCDSLTGLEDIYLPFRPKKKTRATKAKEKGLEELAAIIFEQKEDDPEKISRRFLSNEVPTIEDALQGAGDIMAEWINEDRKARDTIREIFKREAVIRSSVHKGLEGSGNKYCDYFDFQEDLEKCPSHRLLALRRGEKEEFLKVSIRIDEINAIGALESIFVRGSNRSSENVRKAVADSYKRLLRSSIEKEFAKASREKADHEAIKVFTANLRQLLMAPPLGNKRVLAIDPSFGRFAKNRGLSYISLDLKGGRRTIRGIYHIQNVNSYHSRLKNWIARFKGVATRYLSNYLHWFEFIDTVAKDKTQEAAGRALLLRACSVKAV